VPVGTALLGTALTVLVAGTSYFVAPVTTDLDFTRSAFMIHYSLFTLLALVSAPLVGRMAQRFGARIIVGGGGLWIALGVLAMSMSNSLWMFYAIGVWVGVALFPTTALLNAVVIEAWFSKGRGTMMGLSTGVGGGLGGILASIVFPPYIADHGWRAGYALMAAMIAILMTSAFLLIRNRPEELGLNPFGAGKETTNNTARVSGLPYREALKSKELWLLMAGIALFCTSIAGQEHYPAYLVGQGMDPSGIATIMSIFFFLAMPVMPLVGFLTDKLGFGWTMAIVWALGSGGWIVLIAAGHATGPLAIGVFLVLVISTLGVFPALLTRAAFGPKDYAGLAGIVVPSGTLGIAIGAPLWGLSHDLTGSYVPVFALSPVILALGFLLSLTALKSARKRWSETSMSTVDPSTPDGHQALVQH